MFFSFFTCLRSFRAPFEIEKKKREFVMRLQLFVRYYCSSMVGRRCRKMMCECTIALAHAKINQRIKKILFLIFSILSRSILSFAHPLTPNCVLFSGLFKIQTPNEIFCSVYFILFKVCTPWLLRTSQNVFIYFNCCSIASAAFSMLYAILYMHYNQPQYKFFSLFFRKVFKS